MVERKAQTTQTSAPWRETHAYLDRRVESAKESPICTNSSTVIVDVVSADVNRPVHDLSQSFTTAEIVTGRPTDKAISDINAIETINSNNEEGDAAIDHVYEEVGLLNESVTRYEILNYQEKYRTENSKKLTDKLLPSYKICAQCASLRGNPVVYSDRLIYRKEEIYAKEAIFYHPELSPQLYFKYRPLPGDVRVLDGIGSISGKYIGDYMPVCNLIKANASGILYSPSVLKDVFDLDTSLGPSITLLNSSNSGDESNTQVYHRLANNYYSRVSETRSHAPMTFRRIKSSRMFSTIKSTGYDENMIHWMNCDNDLRKECGEAKRHNDEQQALSISQHNNRSSLLLLEPLLLMPELTNTRKNIAKNRITHSEHVKIVRMVIAYTLSFFLLAIITFYIVYFT